VFRDVVDGEVTPNVCVHVDDLVVERKDKDMIDAFYSQPQDKFPVNDMGDPSWSLGCAFERDMVKDVVEMTQTTFIRSLVERFDIQYKWQTPLFLEFDLEPNRRNEKEGG